MSFEHIVIAGAGHAGGCAAHALRAAGFAGNISRTSGGRCRKSFLPAPFL
jgi:predicted NAD/FAD-dependent oxidoreductase